ncbi:MAG: CbrC family protein [Actinomycetota bacterium]
MELPAFRYHPDPVATGSIVASTDECAACKRSRGYAYTGPIYARGASDVSLCPWCIADGSAHAKLGASFTDEDGVGNYGDWDEVPREVVDEIATRTPGFTGWQQERWWTHCGDAAAYLGLAGRAEVEAYGSDLIAALQTDTGLDGEEWTGYFQALDAEGSPTAYVFRCLHCAQLGGYSDCH